MIVFIDTHTFVFKEKINEYFTKANLIASELVTPLNRKHSEVAKITVLKRQ